MRLNTIMTSGQPDLIATSPRPGHYEIDPAGSTVAFRTTHLFGLLPVRGTFTVSRGTVEVAESITESTVHAEIDMASFRTLTPLRDTVVRSRLYLDTDRYPTSTFASQRWDGETLTGTLTVRDIAKPATLVVGRSVVDGDSFTVPATASVDRTDFGVTATPGMLGRFLSFFLTVRCVRK